MGESAWHALARFASSSDHPARNSAFQVLCRLGSSGIRASEFFSWLKTHFKQLPRGQQLIMIDTLLRELARKRKPDIAFARQCELLWLDPEFDRIRDMKSNPWDDEAPW